jgi:dTDP-4-dehydrorhamnose 3,5-epimerase-like enzyme
MTEPKVEIHELPDHGDQRGFSFTIPAGALRFIGEVKDVHVAAILPGSVRGNHFHQKRREILVLTYSSDWSFHWDEGAGTAVQQRAFQGSGAVLIVIRPGASHAVRNNGTGSLTLMAASSESYDPNDSIARKVT